MPHKDLKIKVKDIQHQYPLSVILHQSLTVNCADMSLLTFKEVPKTSFKSRPTARKSTNSKLKLFPKIDDSPNPEKMFKINKSQEETCATTYSKEENTTMSNSISSQNKVTLRSIICSDHKIKITKGILSSENCPSSILELKDDGHMPEASDFVPVKSKSCDSVATDEMKPISKSYVSDDSGCATSSSSSECLVDSLKLKENTTTLNEDEEHPPIQFASNQNVENSIQKTATIDTVVLSSEGDSSYKSSTAADSASTNPNDPSSLKMEDMNTDSSNVTRKSKIENIVDNLNLKQHQTCATSTSESAACPKRHVDKSFASSETNPKKQKLCDDSKDCISLSSDDTKSCKDDLSISSIKNNVIKIKADVSIKKEKVENATNSSDEDDKMVRTKAFLPKFDHLQPEIDKYLQEHFQNQIDLRLKLHKKSEMYNKLKEKYVLLEETFRNWINFAQGLQSRAKMVATQLHKQQETIKTLQSIPACQKVSVGVQTEKDFEEKRNCASLQKIPINNNFTKSVSPHKSNSTARLTSPPPTPKSNTSAVSSPLAKRHSDVIDLTDEVENLAAKDRRDHSINQQVHRILQRKTAKNVSPSKASTKILKRPNQMSPRGVTSLPGINNPRLPVFQPPISTTSICFGDQQSIMYRQQIMRAAPNTAHRTNSIQAVNGQIHGMRHIRPAPAKPQPRMIVPQQTAVIHPRLAYPPLPTTPFHGKIPRNSLGPPPELTLGIKQANGGIVLSWNNLKSNAMSAKVIGYELYAFHQSISMDKKEWKKIGDDTIAAMDLPMACTLSQFSSSSMYYFAVRGRDIYGRFGPFSKPCNSNEVT